MWLGIGLGWLNGTVGWMTGCPIYYVVALQLAELIGALSYQVRKI